MSDEKVELAEAGSGAATPAKTTRGRPALKGRATEASKIIGKLIKGGLTTADVAAAVRVSDRTIYRWWKEGQAPHPIMLDGLRKLMTRRGA